MIIHSDITDIDFIQWNELVKKSTTSSFFQTSECYHFYASLSFLKPFVYAVSEDNQLLAVLCGYLISDGNILKRFFSRRAIVPGGVLLDPRISHSTLQKLLEHTTLQLSQKAIYLEIRNYNDFSANRPAFESAGFSYIPHLNFHVATPNAEAALMQLNTTKRRDVRLSVKEGAEWLETKDSLDIKTYYKLLQELYKTKIKTPLFPFEFFEKLIHIPQGKLFVVKYKGNVIGGSICVILPDQSVYEWFVCGLDGQTKNVFPSTLATWAAIEYAAMNNFSYFDMMGAGKPDESYGVREFKSKFGGDLVEHGRFLYVCKPFLYSIGKQIIKKIKSNK